VKLPCQRGHGAVADAGHGEAAGRAGVRALQAVEAAFGDGERLQVHRARDVEHGVLEGGVGGEVRVGADGIALGVGGGIDVGQVVDFDVLDVQQLSGLGVVALGVDFQGVVFAGAGVDVGLVQQLEATGDDEVVVARGVGVFTRICTATTVVDGGREDDGDYGLRAGFGDVLVDVDVVRLCQLVAVGVVRDQDLRVGLDLLLEQAQVAFLVEDEAGQQLEVGVVDVYFGGVDGTVCRAGDGDGGGAVVVLGDVDHGGQRCQLGRRISRTSLTVVQTIVGSVGHIDQSQLYEVETGDVFDVREETFLSDKSATSRKNRAPLLS